MKFRLTFMFLLFAYLALAQSTVIYINMDVYKNDEVIINDLKLVDGTESNLFGTEEGFSLKVIDLGGKILFETELPVGFHKQISTVDGDEIIDTNQTNLRIRLPYFAEAQYVDLYHKGEMIKRISLSDYLCNNNNICEDFENPQNCPSDCRAGPRKEDSSVMLAAGILLIVIGIASLYFLKKRRGEARESEILRKRRV